MITIRLILDPYHPRLCEKFPFLSSLSLSLCLDSDNMSTLSSATYGKTKVGVFRVVREEERRHVVVEYNVTVLLEGEIGTR